jgi:FkbM family methyltransferase
MEYHTRLHSCKKEPETIAWIEQEFKMGDVFYDIGANVGTYSLVAAARWEDSIRIVAIEPSAINFARLIRNLVLNGYECRVTALPVALGPRTEISTFHCQNLVAGGSLHALGEARDYRGMAFTPAASYEILSFDLDTLVRQFHLPAPTHLKLDVDGTELQILRGAEEALSGVHSVLVESNQESGIVGSFLTEHGFEEVRVYPYRYGDRHPEFRNLSNILFRNTRLRS